MEKNDNFRSGFVAIIGRPNVGKSTILNALIGEKLAIVTPKAQTTRQRALAIYNDEDSQIIFVDTPGFHKSRTKLGDFMVSEVHSSLEGVDVIALVADRPELGDIEEALIKTIEKKPAKKILCFNKIDEIPMDRFAEAYKRAEELCGEDGSKLFDDIIGICAIEGRGTAEFRELIKKHLPLGPMYYPDDQLTDQSERSIAAEIIREKTLLYLSDEVPHGIAVDVVSMKERDDRRLIDISADIICEKDSHKGIVIGRGGRTLKGIGAAARKDMERFFGKKINLKIFVKVRRDWRNNDNQLSGLGYKK